MDFRLKINSIECNLKGIEAANLLQKYGIEGNSFHFYSTMVFDIPRKEIKSSKFLSLLFRHEDEVELYVDHKTNNGLKYVDVPKTYKYINTYNYKILPDYCLNKNARKIIYEKINYYLNNIEKLIKIKDNDVVLDGNSFISDKLLLSILSESIVKYTYHHPYTSDWEMQIPEKYKDEFIASCKKEASEYIINTDNIILLEEAENIFEYGVKLENNCVLFYIDINKNPCVEYNSFNYRFKDFEDYIIERFDNDYTDNDFYNIMVGCDAIRKEIKAPTRTRIVNIKDFLNAHKNNLTNYMLENQDNYYYPDIVWILMAMTKDKFRLIQKKDKQSEEISYLLAIKHLNGIMVIPIDVLCSILKVSINDFIDYLSELD